MWPRSLLLGKWSSFSHVHESFLRMLKVELVNPCNGKLIWSGLISKLIGNVQYLSLFKEFTCVKCYLKGWLLFSSGCNILIPLSTSLLRGGLFRLSLSLL